MVQDVNLFSSLIINLFLYFIYLWAACPTRINFIYFCVSILSLYNICWIHVHYCHSITMYVLQAGDTSTPLMVQSPPPLLWNLMCSCLSPPINNPTEFSLKLQQAYQLIPKAVTSSQRSFFSALGASSPFQPSFALLSKICACASVSFGSYFSCPHFSFPVYPPVTLENAHPNITL